jgi:hypothetical protein
MIKCLEYLIMTDIVLDPSPLPLPTSTAPHILMELELKDIHNSQSLAENFDLVDCSVVAFTHSAIGDVGPFNSEGRLILEDIDADQDLVPLLRSWEGSSLTVKGCPSFNDTGLHMMTPREDSVRNCAYDMAELIIVDCPNFSFAALRQLVSAKLNSANGPDIQSIAVDGHASVISAEDYQWLSENVDEFYTKP